MGNYKSLEAKIVTVSDGVFSGHRDDISGVKIEEVLALNNWDVVATTVVADGEESVAKALLDLSKDFHGLIVTTGGTGFGPRDLTPEGTAKVIERTAPGIAESIRLVNPLGRLSRSTAGTLGETLVINLPGSAKGSIECLEAVIDILGHAVRLISDNSDSHPEHGRDDE
ncbi:MAG TPA: MogA/MoaB family molybdenum cofactor biosynthesis protein [Acidimicrobiales bacterium]|nr:MogA/MoaB family molybdenum cofactor biosynthesis protein [Acidimicrobiales bacterium]